MQSYSVGIYTYPSALLLKELWEPRICSLSMVVLWPSCRWKASVLLTQRSIVTVPLSHSPIRSRLHCVCSAKSVNSGIPAWAGRRMEWKKVNINSIMTLVESCTYNYSFILLYPGSSLRRKLGRGLGTRLVFFQLHELVQKGWLTVASFLGLYMQEAGNEARPTDNNVPMWCHNVTEEMGYAWPPVVQRYMQEIVL